MKISYVEHNRDGMILVALSCVVISAVKDVPLRIYEHDYTYVAPPKSQNGSLAVLHDPHQTVVLSQSAMARQNVRRAAIKKRLENGFSARGIARVGYSFGKSFAEKPIVDLSTGTMNGRFWRQARLHDTVVDASELGQSRFGFDVRRVCNRIGEKLFLTGFYDGSRPALSDAFERSGIVRGNVRGRSHLMRVKLLSDGRFWAFEENEATQSPRSQATYVVFGFDPRSGQPAKRVEVTTVSADQLIKEIYVLRTSFELKDVFGWCGPLDSIPEGVLSRDGRGLGGTSNAIQ